MKYSRHFVPRRTLHMSPEWRGPHRRLFSSWQQRAWLLDIVLHPSSWHHAHRGRLGLCISIRKYVWQLEAFCTNVCCEIFGCLYKGNHVDTAYPIENWFNNKHFTIRRNSVNLYVPLRCKSVVPAVNCECAPNIYACQWKIESTTIIASCGNDRKVCMTSIHYCVACPLLRSSYFWRRSA